jgi:hypothetical protein
LFFFSFFVFLLFGPFFLRFEKKPDGNIKKEKKDKKTKTKKEKKKRKKQKNKRKKKKNAEGEEKHDNRGRCGRGGVVPIVLCVRTAHDDVRRRAGPARRERRAGPSGRQVQARELLEFC